MLGVADAFGESVGHASSECGRRLAHAWRVCSGVPNDALDVVDLGMGGNDGVDRSE